MADLNARFHGLDRRPAPDLWGDIERRAMSAHPARRSRPSADRAGARLALAGGTSIVLALGVLGAGLLGVGSLGPASPTAPTIVAPSPSPTPGPWLPGPASLSDSLAITRTGSLLRPRCGHVAVRLDDGRVLVVGGHTDGPDGSELASGAELYDPATGTFSAVAGDVPAGDHASATLLADGRVLIAGGWGGPARPRSGWESWACQTRYEVDGPDEDSAAAWLFDPATGVVEATTPMLHARSGHAAVLLQDGRVLVAGGDGQRSDGTWGRLASAEVYDPETERWHATAGMAFERGSQHALGGTNAPAATLLDDGRVLVWHGAIGAQVRPVPDDLGVIPAEVFDPAVERFTVGPLMDAADTEPVYLTPSGCACLLRWDPTTGIVEEAGASGRYRDPTLRDSGYVLGNLLMGDRWVAVGAGRVVVKELGTGREAVGTSLVAGEGARRWSSVTPLDGDHLLIAGGITDVALDGAEVVDLRPQ